MKRKANPEPQPSIPSNLRHSIGEYLPFGFVLFGIDPDSGEPITISSVPHTTAFLALNTYIRHYLQTMEKDTKKGMADYIRSQA